MSRPRDMKPDDAVSSRPVLGVHWLLLAIAVVSAVAAIAVQFGGILPDALLSTRIARVAALSGLLTALAALQV